MSAPLLQSPDLVFDKPSPAARRATGYKSLPALGHDHDQLDEELQQLADSLGVLYEHEHEEIEFLESFIDYDDISIIYKTSEAGAANHDQDISEDQIVVVTDKNEEITHEITINGIDDTEENADTEPKLKLGLSSQVKKFKSFGRWMINRINCSCSGSKCKQQKEKNDPKENDEYQRISIEKNETINEKPELEEKSLIKVQSYDIGQQHPEYKVVQRNPSYDKAVTDLENLEKLILKDSLTETLNRKRGMETISEEVDLAFSNLSYDAMNFCDQNNIPHHNYENVDNKPVYENVENNSCDQHYENVPQDATDNHTTEEEYESYDFGENGIYQNIVFSKGTSSVPSNNNADINNKVDALQRCINEVNDIIKSNKDEIVKSETSSSSAQSENNQKIKRNTTVTPVNFRTWALSSPQQPKVDLGKLSSSNRREEESFTQEEKNVVSDFLRSIRNELKM